MNKFLILFCVLMTSIGAYAQSAVSASGGESLGSGGTACYTIGQTFYSANVGTNGQVSEGVQQAYEIYDVTEVQNPIALGISLSVFPNPTNDFLTLRIDGDYIDGLDCTMYDISGKEIMEWQISSSETNIDMQSLPSATYFVRVTKEKNEVKTFKVVKK
ncbi:MAG: T9SS type A sorting domain-containing protein [Bacteroidales bacterium]|nr:T9SS type A sorting domain-containing protein [Bacteroidales bacterium]